jgi:hypothetical protein
VAWQRVLLTCLHYSPHLNLTYWDEFIMRPLRSDRNGNGNMKMPLLYFLNYSLVDLGVACKVVEMLQRKDVIGSR